MKEKIGPSHRRRSAYVYVRQSTGTQVREHRESRRRQYELADRARELGFERVVVLDEDLGLSASGAVERPGFGRLLAAVCEGEVGAVLSLEASRLARNNRDWHHLIDLCALTETLVIDLQGIYDPKQLNDRLLLGLKGTMSEFELGLLRQRALEALRQMVQRGEVLTEVPVGFVRTEGNRCELSPDRQVQEAIRSVFAKYRELGSARQVLLWYHEEKIPLPVVKPATSGREIVWRLPVYHSVVSILKNPIYAGAFVYGRRRTHSRMVDGRLRKTAGHEVPLEEWEVLILDHHPGYISWREYLEHQELLKANRAMRGQVTQGAAKRGRALLAGLLRCARCGRKLHVSYSGPQGTIVRYYCRGGNINHGLPPCISFAGSKVDEAVSAKVLEVISPAGLEAAETAWREQEQSQRGKLRALELAVEKARYESERAHRQFDRAEPENRLVAGELEQRWEGALRRQTDAETRLTEAATEIEELGEEEHQRLLELGRDLESAWQHPLASTALRKRILRSVVEEIVVDIVSEEPPRVGLVIHWAGGVHTLMEVAKNRTGQHQHRTDRKIAELVAELVKVCDDKAIASILNRLGYRTGVGNTWKESRVRTLRSTHRILASRREVERLWMTKQEVACALGISDASVQRLIKEGILPGRQIVAYAPWVIERASLELAAVVDAAAAIREGRRRPSRDDRQEDIPLFSTL